MEFQIWMQEVDEACNARFGVSIYDLPDQNLDDMFEDGYEPSEAIQEIAENEGMDDSEEE